MQSQNNSVLQGDLRRFKRYPVYKASGVEWLGEIPAEWTVKRADAFLANVKRQIDPSSLSDETVFHYSIPSIQATGDGQLEAPSTIDSAKLLINGELLLVSKLNPRKGVVLIAKEKNVPTVASTEFVPFKPKGCDLRWALYLSLAESTRQRLSATVRSATRSHQRAEIADITKVWHAVPSLPEQRAIAVFLDRETARIDTLVARKERLIALLQERRTALITRAVTKGLNPNVPMKDSGVEWLGEIPAHWEVKRLSDVAQSLQTGPFGSQLHADEYVQSGFPVINPANIRESRLIADEDVTVSESVAARLRRHRLQEGDILFARRGELGRCGLVTDEQVGWLCGTGSLRLRLNRRVSIPEFVITYLSMAGVGEWFGLQSVGATMQNLNTSIVGRLPLLVPPTSEQRSIASVLSLETARVDALVARVENAIARLYELRTAIISAAVTGKIDVRETAQ